MSEWPRLLASWASPSPPPSETPLVAARDAVLTPPHVGQAHLRRLPREPAARPLAARRPRPLERPRPPRRIHARGRRVGRRPEGVAGPGPHLHGRARLQGLHAARRLQGDAAGLVGPAGAPRRHGPGRHLGRRPLRRRTEPVRRAGAACVLHAALQRLALRAGARERRAPRRHPDPAHQRRRRGDVRRARARREAGGARCAGDAFPDTAGAPHYSDPVWEPLWSALEEAAIPLSFHIQGPRGMQAARLFDPTPGVREAFISLAPMGISELVAQLIFCGICQRHPGFVFVVVETGFGWITYYLERMDSTFQRHRFWTKSIITEPPSSYWYRQGHATFIEDHPGVKLRHEAGLENILWSSDYPQDRKSTRLNSSHITISYAVF